jgi:hypothetical protein
MSGEADADDESLRILVLAGVRFAAFGRVQEESSAPQMRLACNHLRPLLDRIYRREKKESNSTAPWIKTKNRKV